MSFHVIHLKNVGFMMGCTYLVGGLFGQLIYIKFTIVIPHFGGNWKLSYVQNHQPVSQKCGLLVGIPCKNRQKRLPKLELLTALRHFDVPRDKLIRLQSSGDGRRRNVCIHLDTIPSGPGGFLDVESFWLGVATWQKKKKTTTWLGHPRMAFHAKRKIS